MERTITVNGRGSLQLKPDTVEIGFVLQTLDKNYVKAVLSVSEKIEELQQRLADIGFSKSDLKTSSFNVNSQNRSRKINGEYVSVFEGYSCVHRLKLSFGFDSKRLSSVISVISAGIAEPELNIAFTVKDKSAVKSALLESAAQNARKEAEILTKAAGVKLGALISIGGSQTEYGLYSSTRCDSKLCECRADAVNMDIMPDDIDVENSVNFVWRIE